MGSVMNGFEAKSKGKSKTAMKQLKGKHKNNDGSDIEINTHRDRVYQWAMWRMYLNEDMSQAVFRQHVTKNTKLPKKKNAHASKHNYRGSSDTLTVSDVAKVFTENPEAMRYGHLMKNISKGNHRQESLDTLPDNVYLVYGLPRVCLAHDMPTGIKELHDSAELLSSRDHSAEDEVADHVDTDNCINELFNFVTDEMKNESSEQAKKPDKTTLIIEQNTRTQTEKGGQEDWSQKPVGVQAHTKDEVDAPLPLVSKSRIFWEKLATKKSEIIEIGKDEHNVKKPPVTNPQNGAISSDLLLNQQKMLKKAKTKPRSSRDLWKSLAERKTEILQLRDWDEGSGEVKKQNTKKQESKTSQLWGFIFSKKKELVQMKRGNKSDNSARPQKNILDVKLKKVEVPTKSTNSFSDNFQDNFQRELAAKLKRLRERAESEPVTVL